MGIEVSVDAMLIMLDRMICWRAIGWECVSQVDFIQVACPWQIETDILSFPPAEDLLLEAFKLAFVEAALLKETITTINKLSQHRGACL